MVRILIIVLIVVVVGLFTNYLKDDARKENDIVQLQQLLHPHTQQLKPLDSVLFLSNNTSDEFWFKSQFVLSPVLLIRQDNYTGNRTLPVLAIQDHRANDQPVPLDTIQRERVEVFTAADSNYVLTLYQP